MLVSFNAMIMGLATNGEGEEVSMLFSKMLKSGLHPNAATFLGVLCRCSHSGYVLLSNALAGDQQWTDVSWLRCLMREKRIRKQPGLAGSLSMGLLWIFFSGSVSHPKIEGIYHTLDGLVKEMNVEVDNPCMEIPPPKKGLQLLLLPWTKSEILQSLHWKNN
ncbi:E motif [Dillenia turbinata]|uniref:E motif n=1 Tax=Dillenia turbinata TaxID=194707 RepID=A0AAN8UJ45_9MAGN